MKNFIAKDGVTDANLIRAARDMYKALERMLVDAELEHGKWRASVSFDYAYDAVTKARGEI